jgi:hypothetical protein
LTLLAGQQCRDIGISPVDRKPPLDGAIGGSKHLGDLFHPGPQLSWKLGECFNRFESSAGIMPFAFRDGHQIGDGSGFLLALDPRDSGFPNGFR